MPEFGKRQTSTICGALLGPLAVQILFLLQHEIWEKTAEKPKAPTCVRAFR